ncbi:MAG: AmmeMemoRadiSam system radical SAM enzyme [Gemmatimonadota bacterium]|nr:AmmeMemoRadiSam system radical SAM enzyme [Gemmatimonadota bacterium]
MGKEYREAMFYEPCEGQKLHCLLCPHSCKISEGKVGLCGVRRHENGRLVSLTYEKVTSFSLDPIEKKPLYHFHPGMDILSVGTVGCNFKCFFCQNWEISQAGATLHTLSVDQLVSSVDRDNNVGVAFTYNEPVIWYEYIIDCARLLKEKGFKVVLVTNGYINPEPLEELLPLIDAMNVDLKAFDNSFYERHCTGTLAPVLGTIKMAYGKVHLEVTNLIIPTLNDSKEHIGKMVEWLSNVGVDIPLHFSRYFPHFRAKLPPSSVDSLVRAREMALKKLQYVYLGNIMDVEANTTFCPSCGQALIERAGYSVSCNLTEKKCPNCEAEINLVL